MPGLYSDKKVKEKLENGDFSNIKLNDWFNNYCFDYIMAILDGSKINDNFNLINFIALYTHRYIIEPNANLLDDYSLKTYLKAYTNIDLKTCSDNHEELVRLWNKVIVTKCEEIIYKLLIIICEKIEKGLYAYSYILDYLCKSECDNIRLYCAAIISDYEMFINDPNKRVKKITIIRSNYDKYIADLENSGRYDIISRLEFITAALQNGVITYSINTNKTNDEKVSVDFVSNLFLEESTGWIDDFDIDILKTIANKGILATKIDEMVLHENVNFVSNFIPNDIINLKLKK